ncbi:MAG: sulfate ABC transporter substrate-binding protein [Psychrobacter sp.]|nr:sulfate ABC transporter substrate-binding protein [Psychrobacter sp.]
MRLLTLIPTPIVSPKKRTQTLFLDAGLRFGATLLLLVTGMGLSACQQTPANSQSVAEGPDTQDIELLNVSYDVSRDFYKIYNSDFIKNYHLKHPSINLHVGQSHGGSSKQALAVANGLGADVVTLNQQSDIDLLVDKGKVAANWQQTFPNHAVPYTSTIVFLVRAGNPKHIKDWPDLARPNIGVIMPSPKTSGTAKYAFLAAYGYGLKHLGSEASLQKANGPDDGNQNSSNQHLANQNLTSLNIASQKNINSYMRQLLHNVMIYDNGARAATTTFTQRSMGDVLITTENEAHQVAEKFAKGQVEVVYPSYSIRIENPVAINEVVTAKKGTRQIAHDYLLSLWDKPVQEQMAKLYLRPSDQKVLARYKDKLPDIDTFDAQKVFGPWAEIKKTFFAEGALFDQLARQSTEQ